MNETIQKPFPEKLDERLNAVLAAINTAPKAVLLAAVLDGTFRTMPEIGRRYRRWANWPKANVLGDYIQRSLVTIGLVAEERISIPARDGAIECSWRLSDAGIRYGISAAAFSLVTS